MTYPYVSGAVLLASDLNTDFAAKASLALPNTFTGTLGNVSLGAAGEQLQFSYNGYNYITASGANAVLQIQAIGASGVMNFVTNGAVRMQINSAGVITGTGFSLGAWSAYTPTISGTGWAIGNGTVTAAYAYIGKWCAIRSQITFGSTSTYGTGDLTIQLPVNIRTTSSFGSGFATDASLGANFGPVVMEQTSSTTVRVLAPDPANVGRIGSIKSTLPFTWATTDSLLLSGIYETA